MCGIVGYIGNKKAAPIVLDGLKKLEYRGYDSCGIASCCTGIQIKKGVGKIEEVEKIHTLADIEGNLAIGHTRWATHGGVTDENAHPHSDCSGKICIVHNGIIENYESLKQDLTSKGHKFKSDTDTEIIAHLIEEYNKGDLKEAIFQALKKVEGAYALGIISSDEPDKLFAARKESPLIIGVGEGEGFIASDVPAIVNHTKKVMYLQNERVAVITKDDIEVFDLEGNKKKPIIREILWDAALIEKQGYDHFMLKEINEQPKAIEETINGRIKGDKVDLSEEIKLTDEEIKKISNIVIVACGTSWHAGLVGEFMLEELARVPVEVEYASEFRYRNPVLGKNSLIIAISQSGETADTLAAIKEAKAKGCRIISICNVMASSIARESDSVVLTHAGPEIGVASTKAFTSQLIVLYLITLYFGKIRGILDDFIVKCRIRDLRQLPLFMRAVLEDTEKIKDIAETYYNTSNSLYLGRGIEYPIALEGALKLKEISYIHAEGYPAAEMKHGPIALIDKNMPVVVVATQDNITYNKVLSNIEEVKARGGIIITVATKGDKVIASKSDTVIYIPKTSYILSPVLAVVPLQLLAYYIALKRGCNVDKPRNLAKSVTVE
ncbi:MAG: glutamine--fructose-6-phosphate transaminase (isomerizing) [Nanoarchaeota archaeon]|nr:glutamine--fructose-6-phosphate transaminase (isomerizing) [Nanoarchaeota archaeon]